MSSRGKAVFVLTWGSRGSAHINKVAFQRIATAPNVHVYLAIVSRKKAVAIRRLEMTLLAQLQYHTLDLWQTDLIFTPQHLLLANCYKVL